MRVIMLVGSAGSGKDTAAEIMRRRFGAVSVAMADPLKDFAGGVFDFSERTLRGPSALRDEIDPRYADPDSRHWQIARRAVDGDNGAAFVERYCPAEWKAEQIRHAHYELCVWFAGLHAQAQEVGGLAPRLVLQTLGTDYGRRVFGDDVWVRAGLDEAAYQARENSAPFAVITDGRFPNEPRIARALGAKAIRVLDPTPARGKYAGHASETSLDEIKSGDVDVTITNDKRLGLDKFERQIVSAVQILGFAERAA